MPTAFAVCSKLLAQSVRLTKALAAANPNSLLVRLEIDFSKSFESFISLLKAS